MPALLLNHDDRGVAPVTMEEPADYGFIVVHQKVELEVDFSTKTLRGKTEIQILPQTKELQTIHIHARQCSIPQRQVLVNGRIASFSYEDPHKKMEVPDYFSWDTESHKMQSDRIKFMASDNKLAGTIEIELPDSVKIEEVDPFSDKAATPVTQRAGGAAVIRNSSVALEGGPVVAPAFIAKTAAEQASRFQPLTITIPFVTTRIRDGLQFVGVEEGDVRFPHVYTKHSMERGVACCIFPCVDDSAMRCSWDISIKCSRTLGDALKRRTNIHSHKYGHTNGASEKMDIEEAFLSDEEKLLEMAVICSGEQVDEVIDLDDSSKKIVSFQCTSDISATHVGFAIGPFEQVDLSEYREGEDEERLGQGQSTAIYGYCLPGRTEELRNTCAPLAHAIDHFVLTLGSFPFSESKFVFVDDQVNDTEHTASLSLCSSRLLFPEDIIDPEMDTVRKLVHAIASQYVGVSIVPDRRSDRWLIVGISHFMTNTFMKTLCGNNEFMFRQKLNTDRLVKLDIDRPSLHALGEIVDVCDAFREFMELKAPLVLFILDKRIAKAQGGTGISRVISKMIVNANASGGADSTISTEGFRKSCEKITKYRDTDSFFTQWVLGAGCPHFTITQKFNKKRLCVEMTITQTQANSETELKLHKDGFYRSFKESTAGVIAPKAQNAFTGPRMKERANAGIAMDINAENHDDALIYCLGDVLQSPQDIQEWGLRDWDPATEAKMEAESYEWIRVDADFEWICDKKFTGMEAYMYVSQLQQDRDISAQYESMAYLDNAPPHPLVATFLIRTLMDRRYFYGIRTMAAKSLAKHAVEKDMPRSNDFSDKQAYWIECAIPEAMSRVRSLYDSLCPKRARQFILDQLRFNDNGNNDYSDNFKVANLLKSLADSLIPGDKGINNDALQLDEAEEKDEPREFKNIVLEELDRYSRMDEWIDSYQNIYTITVIECKLKLMNAGVIPVDALDFAQYLHDGSSPNVRIKASWALADLGFLKNTAVACLLVTAMSTDPSPWVRGELTKAFYYGLGVLGLGEYKTKRVAAPVAKDGLIIEEASTSARQEQAERSNIIGALASLKLEVGGNTDLKNALWKAVLSPVITVAEQMDFLDLCTMFCYPKESLNLKLKYPRYWRAEHRGKGRMVLKTKKFVQLSWKELFQARSKPLLPPATCTLTHRRRSSVGPSAERPTMPLKLKIGNSSALKLNNSPALKLGNSSALKLSNSPAPKVANPPALKLGSSPAPKPANPPALKFGSSSSGLKIGSTSTGLKVGSPSTVVPKHPGISGSSAATPKHPNSSGPFAGPPKTSSSLGTTKHSSSVHSSAGTSKPPGLVKLSSSSGDMKPPKRPLPADIAESSNLLHKDKKQFESFNSSHKDKKPALIVKLKVPASKLKRIVSSPRNSKTKAPSSSPSMSNPRRPSPKPSPKPSSKPSPASTQSVRASPALAFSSSSSGHTSSNVKKPSSSIHVAAPIRKPLPEGRKPLPDSAHHLPSAPPTPADVPKKPTIKLNFKPKPKPSFS
ncbi:c532a180-3347-4721-a20c-9240cff29a00 [Sclerotinia trifoliorum]|uniref:Transcription initiation factor TFIID subunit 2 n=1 Tax=Sclerotinia trifoliorum TaxID=28548 RepID=A0A8H2VVU2_9HELO|nr:c532a180-3347-4721-a20c-9240cff29a00 [Sclerotinia trifoliorum]